MKTDRLLSIIIYLLNRDVMTAGELADKFEVSVRTIQRDMDAINLAGIPIVTALHGIGTSLPESHIETATGNRSVSGVISAANY